MKQFQVYLMADPFVMSGDLPSYGDMPNKVIGRWVTPERTGHPEYTMKMFSTKLKEYHGSTKEDGVMLVLTASNLVLTMLQVAVVNGHLSEDEVVVRIPILAGKKVVDYANVFLDGMGNLSPNYPEGLLDFERVGLAILSAARMERRSAEAADARRAETKTVPVLAGV